MVRFGMYRFGASNFYHLCVQTKNIYWFKNLVFTPLICCGFSIRVKYFVLQSLASPETAVYKKANQFWERVAEMATK